MLELDGLKLEPFVSRFGIESQIGRIVSAVIDNEFMNDIVVVGIMDAAYRLVTDFERQYNKTGEFGSLRGTVFYKVKSYEGLTKVKKNVYVELISGHDIIKGRDVLLLDVISDSGTTMQAVAADILDRGANHVLRASVFATVEGQAFVDIPAIVNDKFLVGYGLDYFGNFRWMEDVYSVVGQGI